MLSAAQFIRVVLSRVPLDTVMFVVAVVGFLACVLLSGCALAPRSSITQMACDAPGHGGCVTLTRLEGMAMFELAYDQGFAACEGKVSAPQATVGNGASSTRRSSFAPPTLPPVNGPAAHVCSAAGSGVTGQR